MFMNRVLTIIGSMRSRILVSSTCVTVHRRQGPGLIDVDALPSQAVLVIAARSKNLRIFLYMNIDQINLNYSYKSIVNLHGKVGQIEIPDLVSPLKDFSVQPCFSVMNLM